MASYIVIGKAISVDFNNRNTFNDPELVTDLHSSFHPSIHQGQS